MRPILPFGRVFGIPLGARLRGTSAAAAASTRLFDDRFTTADAAPLATPRTAEPTGHSDIYDAASYGIAGSDLQISGAPVAAAAGIIARIAPASYFTRAAGTAIFFRTLNRTTIATNVYFGWATSVTNTSSTTQEAMVRYTAPTTFQVYRPGGGGSVGQAVTLASSTDNHWAIIILRAAGAIYLSKEGGASADGTYTLLWVDAFSSSAILSFMHNIPASANVTMETDDWIVAPLGSPFATEFGATTYSGTTPTSGDTATGVADGFLVFTWTPAGGESLDLSIRRTDDDNRWIARFNQAGSSVQVIERNAGVETVRGTAGSVTFTPGTPYRLEVLFTGTAIRTYSHAAATGAAINRASYTSATFNQTETGIACSGFATGSNWALWPSTFSITVPT